MRSSTSAEHTSMNIIVPQLNPHDLIPLLPQSPGSTLFPNHACLDEKPARIPPIAVGTHIFLGDDRAASFTVVGHLLLPQPPNISPHAIQAPLLRTLTSVSGYPKGISARLEKTGYSLAWITLSDSASRGEREDQSGPAISKSVTDALRPCFCQGFLIPDDAKALRHLLCSCALVDQYDLICTTGSTGLTERDIAPETTERLLDRSLPGFVQKMMAESCLHTPTAILSRACAGILGRSLVLNLPGSVKAVQENLAAVLPALTHTIQKIHNDPHPCGG